MLKVFFWGEQTGIPIARKKRNVKVFKNKIFKEKCFSMKIKILYDIDEYSFFNIESKLINYSRDVC